MAISPPAFLLPALRVLSLSLLFAAAPSLRAQLVFIPDTNMRAWLNDQITGVVDGAGYMDTQHPGIATAIYGELIVTWNPADLTGLEYLTSMITFGLTCDPYFVTTLTHSAFPPALVNLGVTHYPNATMPPLPVTLESFGLSDVDSLVSTPPFPESLDDLNVQYAPLLTNLSDMGSSMSTVELWYLPSLISLNGILPDTISYYLDLGNIPQLVGLSPLPAYHPWGELLLYGLPEIDSIPLLPDGITSLWFGNMPAITSLPDLPDSLGDLGFSNMPQLTCLPILPDGLVELNQINTTGISCVPNMPVGLVTTLPLCGFFNDGNCAYNFPSVAGTVYHDINGNTVRDAGEPGVGYADVEITPGNTVSGVASNGFYAQALDPDTYTMTATASNPYVTSISPASHSAVLVNVSDVDSLNDFGVVLQANVQDLVVDLTQVTPPRPGFANAVQLTYSNQGTIAMSGTVTFAFDTDQTWNSSAPAPDLLAGNTATWNFTNLLIGENRSITVVLHTDSAVALGVAVNHTAVVDPLATDETAGNNLDTLNAVTVGSYDPNDKAVEPVEMTSAQVQAGERLTYTIRFQNTGTYQAERVIITDTLSTDLQWGTMDLLASSHPCTWFIHDGTLRFTFDPIVLPDSTSDEPGSHGFVTFSMVPDAGLVNGEQVGNTANIFFDFNPPVITNEALFSVNDPQATIGVNESVFRIWPNPVDDGLTILFASPVTNAVVEVIDLTGRVTVRTVSTGGHIVLDVAHLAQGTYTVRVGEQVRRFVKE